MNEKKIIEIQINLAEGITEIAELQKRITELTAANKANDKSTNDLKNAYAENTVKIKDYRSQLNLLIKESANQARTDLEKIGHIQKLKAEVSNLTLQYERLSKEELSSTAGKQVLENLKTKREELSKLNEAYGNYQLGVGQYARATNNLSIQLGMVMKELPNFAISARTGIMSLTNNLPMLAEAFKAVKLQQAEMIEQGKKATSMFSLITKSIFGVTGIASIAMVLLQVFNKQIVDWVKGLFKGEKEIKKITNAQLGLNTVMETLNKTMKDGGGVYKEAISSIQQQKKALDAAKGSAELSKKALDDYNSTLGVTFGKATNVNEAIKLIKDNEDSYIEAMKNMAFANAFFSQSANDAAKLVEISTAKNEEIMGEGADKYVKNIEKAQKRLKEGAKEWVNTWDASGKKSLKLVPISHNRLLTELRIAEREYNDAVKEERERQIAEISKNQDISLKKAEEYYNKYVDIFKSNNFKIEEENNNKNKQLLAQFDYESKLMEERGRALEVGRERELAAVDADNQKKLNQSLQHIKRLEQQEKKGVEGATAALAEARKQHSDYEIALTESTNRKKLEINTKYDKLIADHALATLKHQYDMMQAQSYLSAQQQYDATVKFAEDEYDAKMKQLDLQNISEEEYILKSTELWQQRQLAIANGEKKLTEDLNNENQARLNNELTSLTVGQDEQFQKLSDVYDLKRQMLDNQLADELKKIGDNEALRKSIEDKYRAERIALDKEEAVKKVEQWEFWAQKAMGVGSEVNNAISAFAEHELETWRIANEGKANFDAEYEQKKIEIQRNQAKREKALAVFDTTINTAAAIIKMLKDPGGRAGVVLSVLAGITGAAQIATILATPLPSLSSSGSKSSKSSKTTVTEKFHTGTYRPATPTEEQEITRTLLTTERVLSPSQTAIFDNIISRVQSYGGSQAITNGVGVSDTLAEQRMEMAFTRALRNMPNPVMSWTEYTNQAQRQKLLDRNTKFG